MSRVPPLAVGDIVYVEVYSSKTETNALTGARIVGKQVGFNRHRPGWIAVELVEDRADGNEYTAGDVIVRAASMLYRTREIAPKWTLGAADASGLPEVRVDRYRIVPDESAGQAKGA